MNNRLLLVLALWGGLAGAAGLRRALVGHLPAKLRGIAPGRVTRLQVEAVLGPPLERETSTSYYSLTGFRYDTVIEYRGDVVLRVTFRPFRQGLYLANLKPYLKGETRVALPLDSSESPHLRDEIGYFEVPAERVRIRYLEGPRARIFWYELF